MPSCNVWVTESALHNAGVKIEDLCDVAAQCTFLLQQLHVSSVTLVVHVADGEPRTTVLPNVLPA